MILLVRTLAVLTSAYLLGSIPIALLVSMRIRGVDIRNIGDGNLGARNTYHEIGHKFGVAVAIIDCSKGALPVFLAYVLGLSLGCQILAGILAILGHDFPVFANFQGGQGTATSLGTMLVLFPVATLIGLLAGGVIFLAVKNMNISCGVAGATIAFTLLISNQWLLLGYAVTVLLFIPVKLLIDSPRRRAIEVARSNRN